MMASLELRLISCLTASPGTISPGTTYQVTDRGLTERNKGLRPSYQVAGRHASIIRQVGDTTMTKEIIFSDATKLAELIRTKEVSPVEVVQAHLDRIAAVNPKINAIVTLADGALNAAKAAEAAVLAGDELGPLHGVPFTVKD